MPNPVLRVLRVLRCRLHDRADSVRLVRAEEALFAKNLVGGVTPASQASWHTPTHWVGRFIGRIW